MKTGAERLFFIAFWTTLAVGRIIARPAGVKEPGTRWP
jgi:hypothetical protein